MKKHYKPKFNTKGIRDLSYEYGVMRKTNLKEMHIVRYADDFKIICANRNDAERAMSAVKDWLRTRLKLEVSEEKSKVTNVKRHYSDFLGFKIKVRKKAGKWVDQVHMCDKKEDPGGGQVHSGLWNRKGTVSANSRLQLPDYRSSQLLPHCKLCLSGF